MSQMFSTTAFLGSLFLTTGVGKNTVYTMIFNTEGDKTSMMSNLWGCIWAEGQQMMQYITVERECWLNTTLIIDNPLFTVLDCCL